LKSLLKQVLGNWVFVSSDAFTTKLYISSALLKSAKLY